MRWTWRRRRQVVTVVVDAWLFPARRGEPIGPVPVRLVERGGQITNAEDITFTDLPADTYTHVLVGGTLIALGPKAVDEGDTLGFHPGNRSTP